MDISFTRLGQCQYGYFFENIFVKAISMRIERLQKQYHYEKLKKELSLKWNTTKNPIIVHRGHTYDVGRLLGSFKTFKTKN